MGDDRAARDESQVFQSRHPFFEGILHQLMPVFAGTYAQTPAIGALFDLNSHDAVNNDRPGKIIEKQDIAAFAQNQYGFVVFCCALPCIQQLLGRIGAYNVTSIPLNTKGIPGLREWFIGAILMQKRR